MVLIGRINRLLGKYLWERKILNQYFIQMLSYLITKPLLSVHLSGTNKSVCMELRVTLGYCYLIFSFKPEP